MDAVKHQKRERIGLMDQRIVIQSFTESVNSYGERVETWSTNATVWAGVEYNERTSNEGEQAGQEQVQRVVNFTIRDRAINETYRIVYDSRTYAIEAITRSNDRQLMTLTAKQID